MGGGGRGKPLNPIFVENIFSLPILGLVNKTEPLKGLSFFMCVVRCQIQNECTRKFCDVCIVNASAAIMQCSEKFKYMLVKNGVV